VIQSEQVLVVTLTVVSIGGAPWWQACAGGYCVIDRCGARAQELLRQALLSPPTPTPVSDSIEAASSSVNS
jgi:hypothetical protein